MRRDSPRPFAIPQLVRGAIAAQQVRSGVSLRIAQDEQIMDFAELDYAGNEDRLVAVNPTATGLNLSTVAPGVADGDKGDIVVSGGGTVFSFDPAVVSAYIRTLLAALDQAAAGDALGLAALAYKSTVNNADWSGADLEVANGGTGTSSIAAMKTAYSLDNVENKSSATIRGELTSGNVTTALTYTPTSVTGLTGVNTIAAFKTGLSLVKADVGLGSVDNTADAAKNVLSATKLTTARNINGVAFDGTANIAIQAFSTAGSTTIPQISLAGSTNNWIGFNTSGVGAPTFGTRSVGVKFVIYPFLGASTADHAYGIESGHMWWGTPQAADGFKWYRGITLSMLLNSTGLDVVGELRGDSLRIDVAPVAGLVTATHTVAGNVNGTACRYLIAIP